MRALTLQEQERAAALEARAEEQEAAGLWAAASDSWMEGAALAYDAGQMDSAALWRAHAMKAGAKAPRRPRSALPSALDGRR